MEDEDDDTDFVIEEFLDNLDSAKEEDAERDHGDRRGRECKNGHDWPVENAQRCASRCASKTVWLQDVASLRELHEEAEYSCLSSLQGLCDEKIHEVVKLPPTHLNSDRHKYVEKENGNKCSWLFLVVAIASYLFLIMFLKIVLLHKNPLPFEPIPTIHNLCVVFVGCLEAMSVAIRKTRWKRMVMGLMAVLFCTHNFYVPMQIASVAMSKRIRLKDVQNPMLQVISFVETEETRC
ncbi:hypothetical protein SUGI_0394690 [Cryptomeria japonica]|nr:hypothetical protein SUGI_0394690 [Cryptomeria japonica]